MKITEVKHNGKSDLSIYGGSGKYEEFTLTISERFEITVFAEVYDSNRKSLDVSIAQLLGVAGELFEAKPKYQSTILRVIKEYCEMNEEDFRDSEQDWIEYYSEM